MAAKSTLLIVSNAVGDDHRNAIETIGNKFGEVSFEGAWKWNVDCKYYTAIVSVENQSFASPVQAKNVEAILVLLDLNAECVENFKKFHNSLTSLPDVYVLLNRTPRASAVELYDEVEKFCSEVGGLEMVSMEATEEYMSDMDFGFRRVQNALLVNPWTGMKRKKGDSEAPADDTEKLVTEFSDALNKAASGQDSVAITSLADKLAQIRAKSKDLDRETRQKCAAQIATSFENVLSGDD